MSSTGLIANVTGGVIGLLLVIYLCYALIRPEKF